MASRQSGLNPNASEFWPVNHPRNPTYHFLNASTTHDPSVSYTTPKTTTTTTNTPPAPPSSPPPTVVHPPTPTPSSLPNEDVQPTGGSLGKHQEVMVFCCTGNKTTVIIRNVPKWSRREDVILLLKRHCYIENRKGQQITSSFDFVHLPMNNRNGTSCGYALVNFSSPVAARIFYHAFDDRYNVFWGSRNKVHVVASLIQGKEALVNEFEATMFDCGNEDFLPVCFSPARDGSRDQLVTMTTVGKCRATPASSSSDL